MIETNEEAKELALAVSEKLSTLGTKEFLEKRAKRTNREKFLKVLKSAPDIESDEEDRF